MVQTGHNAYLQNVGNTVIDQDQILLKLYDGSLKFLRLARRGMEDKNPRIKGENISKVLAIMTELSNALDMKTGGEIVNNLSILYEHVIFRLIDANINNDIKGIDETEHILAELKEGFELAAKFLKASNRPIPVVPSPSYEHKEGIRLAV
jgi:flagellar protein FliS